MAHQLVGSLNICCSFRRLLRLLTSTTICQSNVFTEIVFEDALSQARELDKYFKETGTVKSPLHGIPFTVKDQFNIRGVDTTLGYVGRAFRPAADDAVLVTLLKRMGAVVIAKTNLPQSIMVHGSSPRIKLSFLLTHDSGVRRKTLYGVLLPILAIQHSHPAGQQEENPSCWLSKAPSSDLEQTSVAVCGYHRQ